jgi:hypothetical protein
MTISTEEGVALGSEKGGDDVSWTDMILTGVKNEKKSRCRFSCYKWTVKI